MNVVYQNPWFSVIKDGQYHYVKESNSPNGAVVLAKSPKGFVFVEVHRPANNGVFIEAPRGYGDRGESARQCAARELKEETGFELDDASLIELGRLQPNSAILSSTVAVFFGEIEQEAPSLETDGEARKLIYIPEDDLKNAVATGRITDGFTLSAIALLWAMKSTP